MLADLVLEVVSMCTEKHRDLIRETIPRTQMTTSRGIQPTET
jgi:hypothetical protein